MKSWRNAVSPAWTQTQSNWLRQSGALTDRLRTLGNLQVHVVHEFAGWSTLNEAKALAMTTSTPMWVREIMMTIDDKHAVVARSLTSLTASLTSWKAIRSLQTKPLADILYHDTSIERSNFSFARLNAYPSHPLHQLALDYCESNLSGQSFLARRSIFTRKNQQLLVSECFLPEFWLLLE